MRPPDEPSMGLTPASIADLPVFPFRSYEEFLQAHREGKVFIGVKYCVPVVWALGSAWERFLQVVLVGSGLWVSALLTILAFYQHDVRYLWGIVASLLGFLSASPAPSCAMGCIPGLLGFVGGIVAAVTHSPLPLIGFVGLPVWFATSAGLGVGDLILREEMLRSEETFLRLYSQGSITEVWVEIPVTLVSGPKRRPRRKKR